MSHVSPGGKRVSHVGFAFSLSLLHRCCLRIKDQPFPGYHPSLPYPQAAHEMKSQEFRRGVKKAIHLIYSVLHYPVSLESVVVERVFLSTFFRRILNSDPSQSLGRRDPVNLLTQKEFSHKIAQIITSTKSNGIVSFRSTLKRYNLCSELQNPLLTAERYRCTRTRGESMK